MAKASSKDEASDHSTMRSPNDCAALSDFKLQECFASGSDSGFGVQFRLLFNSLDSLPDRWMGGERPIRLFDHVGRSVRVCQSETL